MNNCTELYTAGIYSFAFGTSSSISSTSFATSRASPKLYTYPPPGEPVYYVSILTSCTSRMRLTICVDYCLAIDIFSLRSDSCLSLRPDPHDVANDLEI